MEETMKKALVVSIGIVFLLIHIRATAEEKPENLGEIVVSGERLITPTKQTAETVYTGTEITKKGIEIQGPKADTSVYEAISILPDIIVESPDPLGLTPEQKNIRVRGVRGYFGALTVEGVPNYGGNPIGPRDYLYDTEDLQSIAVYEGAVPADLGTGVGGRAGAIELRPLWPKEKFSLDVSQGFGSNSYSRSFLRVDSGKLPKTGTRL
jgi:iron complex outermembrane receptor protein